MKKITLSVALFLISISSISATSIEKNNTNVSSNDTDKKIDGPKIYQWYVKTNAGVYAGTANSLDQANKMIANAATNSKIVSQDVQAISLRLETKAEKIYTWGASTSYGFASGTSGSYSEAEKMLKFLTQGDIKESQIIESFKIVK